MPDKLVVEIVSIVRNYGEETFKESDFIDYWSLPMRLKSLMRQKM